MFANKSRICLDGARRKSSLENSLFNQRVSEEDRRDKILEYVFMRSTQENPYHKQIQASIDLSKAIKAENKNKFLSGRRELVRRLTRTELQQLERQLRAAYVSKAVIAQSFERAALKEEKKAKAHIENLGLEEARMRQDEYAQKMEEQVRQKKLALKLDLLEQMSETKAKRQEEKMEEIKDRQRINASVKRHMEEERQLERAALEKKIKIRNDMIEFDKIQKQWKLEQSAASAEEEKKAEELLQQRKAERKKLALEKKELKERKDKLSEAIGKRTHAISVEKMKALDFLNELLIDERKAKEEMKARKDAVRQMQDREAAKEEVKRIREEKERQKAEAKHQDELMYQEELRVRAEGDRLQALEDEKKKLKKLEHRKALQDTLDEKKRFQAKEMKRLLMAEAAEVEDNARKSRQNQLARIALLKEHTPVLRGFLPPGLIRHSDLEFMSY